MPNSINNGERIFEWAQQVQLVAFVQMINKKFAGLVLHDKRDAQAVIAILDNLLGELTHIENVTETGLGIPLITVKESSQYEDGVSAERDRVLQIIEDYRHKPSFTFSNLISLIKGEQK